MNPKNKGIQFEAWRVDQEFGDWVYRHVQYGGKDPSEITYPLFAKWAAEVCSIASTDSSSEVLVNVKTGEIPYKALQWIGRFQSQGEKVRSPLEIRQSLHEAIITRMRSQKMLHQPWSSELTAIVKAGGPSVPLSTSRRAVFPLHPWMVGFVLGAHKNIGYAYIIPILDT